MPSRVPGEPQPHRRRAVAAAAGASYVEVPGARHNDPDLSYGPLVANAVARISI
jgi:hypothetical protein